jgi:hypothetical protein
MIERRIKEVCCYWRSPHRALRVAASTVRGLLFTFLTGRLPQLLDDVQLAMRQTMWFMHYGAPAHFTPDVKQFLDSHYPDRRNGPVLWPPRSPDLTPVDLYLWGHLKDIVYSERDRQHAGRALAFDSCGSNATQRPTWNFSSIWYQDFLVSHYSVMP